MSEEQAAGRPLPLPPEIGRLAWLFLAALLVGILASMARPTRSLALRLLPGARLARIRRWPCKEFFPLYPNRALPWLITVSLLLALIFQLMRCASLTVGAMALDHSSPFTLVLAVYPVMLLVSLLPVTIAGLGVREVGSVYFLGPAGMVGIGRPAIGADPANVDDHCHLARRLVVCEARPSPLTLRGPTTPRAQGGRPRGA